MENDKRLKIYFAYSGRDKEGENLVDQTIQYLIWPGKNNKYYAEAVPHPESKRNKNIVEKIWTVFCRVVLANFLLLLEQTLGDWFVSDKLGWKVETEGWRIKSEKLIGEADAVVFLYSINSADEKKAKNIKWEINTAKRLDRNVILCRLDNTTHPPDWIKKVDKNALGFVYSQEELRKRIEHHDLKKYKYTTMNLRELVSNPSSKAAERMFEQYKMYKSETENLVNTRQNVSNLFLLMNGGLLTLIGVALTAGSKNQPFQSVLPVLFISSLTGILMSKAWIDMVSHYKDVNRAKQRLINAVEENLPLQLNATEYYDIMKDPLKKGRYKSFEETIIPNTIHAIWGVLFLVSSPVFLGGLLFRFGKWSFAVLKSLFPALASIF